MTKKKLKTLIHKKIEKISTSLKNNYMKHLTDHTVTLPVFEQHDRSGLLVHELNVKY